MTTITRNADAIWRGDLRGGEGTFSTESRALNEQPYNFRTRFENEPGSNPEEVIAAAHAACFSMAFAGTLTSKGYQPESIQTNATCIMVSKQSGGFEIVGMQLKVRGSVPDLDEATFKRIAAEADEGCPVSNLLRCGLKIEIEASLL